MSDFSYFSFLMAFAALVVAFAFHAVATLRGRSWLSFAGAGAISVPADSGGHPSLERHASQLTRIAFFFLTASLVLRSLATGHGPFSNMFEFSLAFGWGILALHLYFASRYELRILALPVLPVVFGLMAYATTVPNRVEPLVPALQNEVLLTVHVALAIVAYGAFSVAFGAAVLYLVQRKDRFGWLPGQDVLDEVGYRAVIVGFPMLAAAILLGAVWAEIAWGTYWSWDPKETASLATWLIYGGYLHARVVRGWRGQRSALLLIGGFGATLFTYYGNLFFGGMHSYG